MSSGDEHEDESFEDRVDEDEDEDYEEEEEEEEEEDSRPRKKGKTNNSSSSKGKKKAKSSRMDFFEDEADEDDGLDEEEEYEAEDGWEDMKDQVQETSSGTYKVMNDRANQFDQRSLEEIAAGYEREQEYDDDDYDEDLDDLAGLPHQSYWRLKCKVGEEKLFVAQMMQKAINQQNAPPNERILIKSVLAPNHLPGHVYVEAERELHVKQAIKGMSSIMQSGIILIPLKDMIEILSTNRKSTNLPKGTWVRCKLGKYKDDIGQVVEYKGDVGRCTVKLIPRIDMTGPSSATEEKTAKRKKIRPAQSFFNYNDLSNKGYDIAKKRDHYIMGGEKYQNGFLLKQMRIRSLITDGVVPSLEELQKFQNRAESENNYEGDDNDSSSTMNSILDAQIIPRVGPRPVSFSKGDTVKVIDGDLKNLMGVVESVDDKSVAVLPIHDALNEILIFNPSELQKYFKIGDHVKVISGRYEGETGLVLRIEDIAAVLLSDLTISEIKVRPQDLQECTEIATGKLELGNYELHDLVQITPQKVGIIVKVERDSFKILDENGNVTTVKLQEVGNKRRTKTITTLDTHHNTLNQNDVVEVVDGQYRGKQGVILHISRNFLFLKSKDVFENGGIFVVRATYCSLLGGSKNKTSSMFQPPSNSSNSNGGGGGRGGYNNRGGGGGGGFGGRGGGGGGRGRGRDDSPLHKTVTIKSGSWKGYVGVVRECTDTMVQVELQTNSRRINVQRNNILLPGERVHQQSQSSDWDSSSSSSIYLASRTPMREENPAMTPMRINTPARHSDPWGSQTPARNSMYDDDISSSTPNDYYGTTPGTNFSYSSPFTPSNDSHRNENYTPINMPTPQFDTPSYMMGSYEQPTPQGSDIVPPSPFTPYAPQTPATPSTPSIDEQDDDLEGTPWQGVDIEVTFKSGTEYSGQLAFVKDCKDGIVTVELQDGKLVKNLSQESLELVQPAKKDRVIVIKGQYTGSTGTLFVISPGSTVSGIVKMDSNLDFKVFKMGYLGKAINNEK